MLRHRTARAALLALAALALCACASPAPPPPTLPLPPTAPAFTPAADAGAGPSALLGYLVVDSAGARLASAVSFAAGEAAPLDPPADQIWLGDPGALRVEGALTGGAVRSAVVLARGAVEGPGAYGPGGAHRRQIAGAQITVLVPEETSVAALQERSAAFQGRVVRVVGGIVAGRESAVLVDRLGAGGVPAPGARQVKLRGAERDTALLGRLAGRGDGPVRYGPVQVEGYWRDGAVVVLAVHPVAGG